MLLFGNKPDKKSGQRHSYQMSPLEKTGIAGKMNIIQGNGSVFTWMI